MDRNNPFTRGHSMPAQFPSFNAQQGSQMHLSFGPSSTASVAQNLGPHLSLLPSQASTPSITPINNFTPIHRKSHQLLDSVTPADYASDSRPRSQLRLQHRSASGRYTTVPSTPLVCSSSRGSSSSMPSSSQLSPASTTSRSSSLRSSPDTAVTTPASSVGDIQVPHQKRRRVGASESKFIKDATEKYGIIGNAELPGKALRCHRLLNYREPGLFEGIGETPAPDDGEVLRGISETRMGESILTDGENEDEGDGEDGDEQRWEVERVTGWTYDKQRGLIMYKVKWADDGSEANGKKEWWLKESECTRCHELVSAFHIRQRVRCPYNDQQELIRQESIRRILEFQRLEQLGEEMWRQTPEVSARDVPALGANIHRPHAQAEPRRALEYSPRDIQPPLPNDVQGPNGALHGPRPQQEENPRMQPPEAEEETATPGASREPAQRNVRLPSPSPLLQDPNPRLPETGPSQRPYSTISLSKEKPAPNPNVNSTPLGLRPQTPLSQAVRIASSTPPASQQRRLSPRTIRGVVSFHGLQRAAKQRIAALEANLREVNARGDESEAKAAEIKAKAAKELEKAAAAAAEAAEISRQLQEARNDVESNTARRSDEKIASQPQPRLRSPVSPTPQPHRTLAEMLRDEREEKLEKRRLGHRNRNGARIFIFDGSVVHSAPTSDVIPDLTQRR